MNFSFYQALLSEIQAKFRLEDLLVDLPGDMITKAKRYRRVEDQYRYVIGKKLIQEGLREFGKNPILELKNIKYTPLGKPFLSDLWFNISHSGNYIACIFSDQGPIGLDIEVLKDLDDPEHLRNWFTTNEWTSIQNSSDPLKALYILWTKKEAILKATGYGVQGLERIRGGEKNIYHLEGETTKWQVKGISLGFQDVVASICYEAKNGLE